MEKAGAIDQVALMEAFKGVVEGQPAGGVHLLTIALPALFRHLATRFGARADDDLVVDSPPMLSYRFLGNPACMTRTEENRFGDS